MKRLIITVLLLLPPLILLQKLRKIPADPIPISSPSQEAEIRGAEAAAAEYKRAADQDTS